MNKLAALALMSFVAFTSGCASTTSSASINFAIAAEKSAKIDAPSIEAIGADPSDPSSWVVTGQNVAPRWHAPDTTVPATHAAANKATKGVKIHN